MANIMLTERCNLRCPYCFANEYVDRSANDISEENFYKALEFILNSKKKQRVGLIGGEPLLHPLFKSFIRRLIKDERVETIVVYTNGIYIDRYITELIHPKVRLLINCNSPQDIGEQLFAKLKSNLHLFHNYLAQDRTALGINLYSPHLKYDYFLELLLEFEAKTARVSITVPNLEQDKNKNAQEYFQSMKEFIMSFFLELLNNGICPYFDCNKFPSCMVEESDLAKFSKYMKDDRLKKEISQSNISSKRVLCSPVIDILQDLTAIRCFGLSKYTRVDITRFKNVDDLRSYYIRTIDAYAFNTVYSKNCIDCYYRQTLKCNGGCLAYKIDDILKLDNYSKLICDNKE